MSVKIMPYPKEKIAHENEGTMLKWLRNNDHKLPLTLYRLSKELSWSFGATRGTLLRLESKNENKILKTDIVDPVNKRFKTKIANRGMASQARLQFEAEENDNYGEAPSPIVGPNEFLLNNKPKLLNFLNKLLDFDDKVAMLADDINDGKLLDKFIDSEFGLESDEKSEIISLIEELEEEG
jgi:hypothetical protein